MKNRIHRTLFFLIVAGILFALALPVAAQPESAIFLSKELNADPYQMKIATEFKSGDPIYLVVRFPRNAGVTIDRLVSEGPTAFGYKSNIHLTVEVPEGESSKSYYRALPEPLDPAVLKQTFLVYTLVPATNDVNVHNADAVRSTLSKLEELSHQGSKLRVTLTNYESEKSISAASYIDITGRKASRYGAYIRALDDAETAQIRKNHLAKTAGESAPVSLMNDPLLEKEVFGLAEAQFGYKYRVHKVALTGRNWGNLTNEFGMVISRSMQVKFMMKDKVSGDCVIHWGMFAIQDHYGGGKFSAAYLVWKAGGGSSWTYFDCAKFTGSNQGGRL
jgi:hypothetical protein